jgi:hypothetical protein
VARWVLSAVTGLAVSLAIAAPAHAARLTWVSDGNLTMNLQAPTLGVKVPMHFEGGVPDSWKVEVTADLPIANVLIPPAVVIARATGTGPVRDPVVPLLDQDWRWRFLNTPDVQVDIRVSWTSGADHGEWSDFPFLNMMTNRGRYDGGEPLPGRFGIYHGLGYIDITPYPHYRAFGLLVHEETKPATFAKGHAMRGMTTVPYVIAPPGATKVRATVEYVPRRRPDDTTVVYRGRRALHGARPGARRDVRVRLTAAGRKLAARIGARKLARTLTTSGRLWFTSTVPGDVPELLAVPMGSCFADNQLEHAYP